MKLYLGGLPPYKDFQPDQTWNNLQEERESLWKWQIKALPIAILNMTITIGLWLLFTPAESLFVNLTFPLPILPAIISLISVMICHEFIHLLFHPKAGLSSKSIIGFWPSKMLLYASYGAELSRNRYLIILITPLLIISIGTLTFSILSSYMSFWIFYISILNSFISAGDILASKVIMQLPANTVIRNKGEDSYWKLKFSDNHTD